MRTRMLASIMRRQLSYCLLPRTFECLSRTIVVVVTHSQRQLRTQSITHFQPLGQCNSKQSDARANTHMSSAATSARIEIIPFTRRLGAINSIILYKRIGLHWVIGSNPRNLLHNRGSYNRTGAYVTRPTATFKTDTHMHAVPRA